LVLLNDGDGRFRPAADYPTRAAALTVAIGDLNSDGKPDLATANHGRDVVSVFFNKATAPFSLGTTTE
jgi:hypothetical protein